MSVLPPICWKLCAYGVAGHLVASMLAGRIDDAPGPLGRYYRRSIVETNGRHVSLPEAGSCEFDVPAKLGAMPAEIDFDYPAKATRFSFRDGNLSLVAMDEAEPSRVRIVISAQFNKTSGTYEGQI